MEIWTSIMHLGNIWTGLDSHPEKPAELFGGCSKEAKGLLLKLLSDGARALEAAWHRSLGRSPS